MIRKLGAITSILFALCIVCAGSCPVHAADNNLIRVFLDNTKMDLDFPPIIRNDRVMIGMRPVFNGFESEVQWNGELKKITAYKESQLMEFYIDNPTYWIDGVAYQSDVPPMAIAGRTYVPLRLIAECFSADVYWNSASNAVFMYKSGYEPPNTIWSESEPNDKQSDADSIYLDRPALPTFTSANDLDWFRLWVHKAGDVNISVEGTNDQQLPVFKLYDEACVAVLATSAANSQGVESARLNLEPGIYYLKIENLGTIMTRDYYKLMVETSR